MVLVLCGDWDTSAFWAASEMQKLGLDVTVLTDSDFAEASAWRLAIGRRATASAIRLGKRSFSGDGVSGVLNRLGSLSFAWTRKIGGPDRVYAAHEMSAFYLAWLHALSGTKINEPTPQGLCGNPRHPSAWAALAHRCGLPIHSFTQSSSDAPSFFWQDAHAGRGETVFVLDGNVIGPAEIVARHREGCRSLAEQAGCALIGIEFTPDERGEARVKSVSVVPDLQRGGDALVKALSAVLAA